MGKKECSMTLREILLSVVDECENCAMRGERIMCQVAPKKEMRLKCAEVALASIRSVLSEEIGKLKPVCNYASHDEFCDCSPIRNQALSEAREVIERLTGKE